MRELLIRQQLADGRNALGGADRAQHLADELFGRHGGVGRFKHGQQLGLDGRIGFGPGIVDLLLDRGEIRPLVPNSRLMMAW